MLSKTPSGCWWKPEAKYSKIHPIQSILGIESFHIFLIKKGWALSPGKDEPLSAMDQPLVNHHSASSKSPQQTPTMVLPVLAQKHQFKCLLLSLLFLMLLLLLLPLLLFLLFFSFLLVWLCAPCPKKSRSFFGRSPALLHPKSHQVSPGRTEAIKFSGTNPLGRHGSVSMFLLLMVEGSSSEALAFSNSLNFRFEKP